jgi:hypothetical protein
MQLTPLADSSSLAPTGLIRLHAALCSETSIHPSIDRSIHPMQSLLTPATTPLLVALGSSDGPAIVRMFDVNRLGLATYFLALLYLLLAAYSLNQLRRIHAVLGSGFDTQKLFHTFVTIHVLIRFLAFAILALFMILHADPWYPAVIMVR